MRKSQDPKYHSELYQPEGNSQVEGQVTRGLVHQSEIKVKVDVGPGSAGSSLEP